MITAEQITAALKKHGPCAPGALADHLQIDNKKVAYQVKKMLDAGTLKAAGTSHARRIGLADQDLGTESAPPQNRKHGKRNGAHKAKKAKRAAPRARPAATPAARFIPTVDVNGALVIVNGGEPHIYSEEQTEAIATLLQNHWKE